MTAAESPPSEAKDTVQRSKRRPHRYLIALGVLGLFASLGVIAVLVFAYSEGQRAERDWNDFRSQWEDKGEIFNLEKLIPPDIPKEENFAAATIIAELFQEHTSARLLGLNPYSILDLKKPTYSTPDSIRALNAPGAPLSLFVQNLDSHSNSHESARLILEVLKPLEPLIEELEKASRLPKAKFPLEYEGTLTMKFSHLRPLAHASEILALRSRAHLITGNSTAATGDLLTLIKIAHLTGSEPSLLSHLIEVNIYQTSLSVIWQGLGDRHFQIDDLKKLDQALLGNEINPRIVKALRAERACFIKFINDTSHQSPDQLEKVSDIEKASHSLKNLGFSKAFWIRNKLNYSSFIQDHGLRIGNEINRGFINIGHVQNFDQDATNLSKHSFLRSNPYAVMALTAMPACGRMVKNSLQTSVRIDLCRTAIALKLYSHELGTYPSTLELLAPTYIDTLPPDPITGAPLLYRVKTDGTPMVYSVGLNKTDDGGLLKKKHALGDWVWQYTLPEDFNEEDWRE